MSNTDDIMVSGQGGRPPEVTSNDGNVLIIDDFEPRSSLALLQGSKEDPVVDTSMSDIGPLLEGDVARNDVTGTGSGGVPAQLIVLGQSSTTLSFKDTLLGRSGLSIGGSVILELDVENNLGVKSGQSKSKDDTGSRFSVLGEEQGLDEERLAPVGYEGNQGLRLLDREKGLAHSVPSSKVLVITESQDDATERSRNDLGNKEGPGLDLKKKAVENSATILSNTARQSQIGEITNVASMGTSLESPRP
ncbi:hypothetical protein V6N11_059236 [Hibiscus sabdariffa]|uniref:Uncharacterized protein n=1 Tax=Hibiscus sabdariffa TaxID=183260 RepID=A0ABR2U7C4_9ROSI